jgi:hypothetical protein
MVRLSRGGCGAWAVPIALAFAAVLLLFTIMGSWNVSARSGRFGLIGRDGFYATDPLKRGRSKPPGLSRLRSRQLKAKGYKVREGYADEEEDYADEEEDYADEEEDFAEEEDY